MQISRLINRSAQTTGQIEEGLKELLVPFEIVDDPEASELVATEGEIIFSQVDFTYGAEDESIFRDLDLTIKAGEKLGLVGPSGAGKSSLISILLRQQEIQCGAIKIDGQDISKVTQKSLRENISIVPQSASLFHRTVRENIAYGKIDATDEEVFEVAKKARIHDFIESLPEGYDTMVGERGTRLSGGQRQRIVIARAMLKNAPILILDEATSALDSENEIEIQRALKVLIEGKTVIAIAHRLSALREMDRIIVMEHGQITEDGIHQELTKAGGTYQNLWQKQVDGFVGE